MKTLTLSVSDDAKFNLLISLLRELRFVRIEEELPVSRTKTMSTLPPSVLSKRRPGRFKGKIKISSDFTETPADVIGSFYGEAE